MSLADKIKSKREQLNLKRDSLVELTENDISGDDTIAEDVTHQITELTDGIKSLETDIENLETARAALAAKALDRQPKEGDDTPKTLAPRIQAHQKRAPGHRATAALACMLKAHVLKASPYEIAKQDLKDEPEIETIIRAATAPATTGDAAWAGPLVQETWSAFLDLLRDVAIYPRLPGMRLEFDRYGKINIPYNAGRGQLAGGYVLEGAPIPVKEGAYATTDLEPKKLAVISSFTREIAEHSMPAIQALVQNQMVEDTAEVLDTLYLDATARSATRPAGAQDTTETGAGNINASTGNTVAAVLADTQAMIGRLLASRSGNGAVWVMNPLRVLGLRDQQDAASGAFVHRSELDAGMFRGYPYIESQNVTADVVLLQGNGAMAYASDSSPRIDVSDQAVLVMDSETPEHIGPDTPALTQPARSMFQTDSVAVKMRQSHDHRQIRADARQILTSVGW